VRRPAIARKSLSLPIDGSSVELGDLFGGPDPSYEYLDNWHSIVTVLKGQADRTRLVLALRFLADKSQMEIAAEGRGLPGARLTHSPPGVRDAARRAPRRR